MQFHQSLLFANVISTKLLCAHMNLSLNRKVVIKVLLQTRGGSVVVDLCTSHCLGGGGSVLVFILLWIPYVLSSFAIIFTSERAGCFAFIVFRMSCYCKYPTALPHGPMGWSAVCDRGIF